MASSTSSPAPRSRSRKPLGRMADWFRQALSKKATKTPVSPECSPSDISQPSSRDSPSPLGPCSEASPTPTATRAGAESSLLVSYLEGHAARLRCFLQLRDATPGGAIVSELCQALSSSHCRVLLITPGFLRDPWCRYQMLQALSEAPGAEGRTIPLMSGLTRAAYPAELRFMYFVDGRGPDGGFRQVQEAVLRYLQSLS
nr:toll/interleukin-1 receptor domain-containing adapter protein [Vicugna pacos]